MSDPDYERLLDAAKNGMDRETAEQIARAALREQWLKDNGLIEYGPKPRTTMIQRVGRSIWPERIRWINKRREAG